MMTTLKARRDVTCSQYLVWFFQYQVGSRARCMVGSIRDIITHGDIMSYIIYIQCHSDHGLVRLIE